MEIGRTVGASLRWTCFVPRLMMIQLLMLMLMLALMLLLMLVLMLMLPQCVQGVSPFGEDLAVLSYPTTADATAATAATEATPRAASTEAEASGSQGAAQGSGQGADAPRQEAVKGGAGVAAAGQAAAGSVGASPASGVDASVGASVDAGKVEPGQRPQVRWERLATRLDSAWGSGGVGAAKRRRWCFQRPAFDSPGGLEGLRAAGAFSEEPWKAWPSFRVYDLCIWMHGTPSCGPILFFQSRPRAQSAIWNCSTVRPCSPCDA